MIPFPNISPELFSINLFGFELALRWYALAYIAGILIAWRLVVRVVNAPQLWPDHTPVMRKAQVEDLLSWAIMGIILGGRLGYVLFYNPSHFIENPGEILRVWEGGMSFHGGLLGVILAAWIFCTRNGLSKTGTADMIAFSAPVGLFLGRLANFINAELWGRPTDLPWGVAFPTQAAQFCPEIQGICARHPSQLYEAILEGLLLGSVLLWLVWRKNGLKTPGFISGVFFAGYAIARFLVEFVRQPDSQFISEGNPLGLALHLNGFGLTMGQILSLPMLALGIALILRARKSPLS